MSQEIKIRFAIVYGGRTWLKVARFRPDDLVNHSDHDVRDMLHWSMRRAQEELERVFLESGTCRQHDEHFRAFEKWQGHLFMMEVSTGKRMHGLLDKYRDEWCGRRKVNDDND